MKVSDFFSDLSDVEREFMDPEAAPWEALHAMFDFMRSRATVSEFNPGVKKRDPPEWPESMPCCIDVTRDLSTHIRGILALRPLTIRGGWGFEADESVVVRGPVYIGRNVQVRKGGVIIGPAFIGDNVIIGNSRVKHSIIRGGSVIESGAVFRSGGTIIQSYVRLRSSIIGRGTRLFPNVCVNDERIKACEVEVHDGERVISTNLSQFGLVAGDDVYIGGGCVTYPGAVVAAGSRVEHGTTLLPKLHKGHVTNSEYDAFMDARGR